MPSFGNITLVSVLKLDLEEGYIIIIKEGIIVYYNKNDIVFKALFKGGAYRISKLYNDANRIKNDNF